MSKREFKSVRGAKLTQEQRRRVREGRAWVEANMPRLQQEAQRRKGELDVLVATLGRLKAERERRGLSLGDVASRSGIDKSRLSKLENAPHPNPTFRTLMRIADAIGVRLTIGVEENAA